MKRNFLVFGVVFLSLSSCVEETIDTRAQPVVGDCVDGEDWDACLSAENVKVVDPTLAAGWRTVAPLEFGYSDVTWDLNNLNGFGLIPVWSHSGKYDSFADLEQRIKSVLQTDTGGQMTTYGSYTRFDDNGLLVGTGDPMLDMLTGASGRIFVDGSLVFDAAVDYQLDGEVVINGLTSTTTLSASGSSARLNAWKTNLFGFYYSIGTEIHGFSK